MNEEQIRLFVAVALPDELKDLLEEQAAMFTDKGFRLVPRQNLHLTLFFIGNTTLASVPVLEQKLRDIAASQSPFSLQLKQTEPGPSLSRPRLVWARFDKSGAFENLSVMLQQLLAPSVGLPKEAIPHITLARARKDQHLNKLLPVNVPEKSMSLQVSELSLWKSVLGQPHPEYSIIGTFPFGK